MKIFRLIISLFFILFIWILFIAGREFLLIKPVENLSHVPENATFAMRIDGSALLKASAFSIILEANDPDLIDVINIQINEKRKRKGPSKNLGIDFLSDIVVYALPFSDGQIFGTTYNLNDPDKMRKNASHTLENNQVFAINQNVGVVLRYSGKNKLKPEQKSEMIALAQKIAFHPSKNELSEKLSEREPNKIIQLSSKGQLFGETTLFNRSDMDLLLEDHGVQISGNLFKNKLEKRVFEKPAVTFVPSGMYFYTTLFPTRVQDTLHKFLLGYNLNLPKIESISINYRGSSIHNTNKNLVYSPDLDLLLTFQEDINLENALAESSILDLLKLEKRGSVLDNGIRQYTMKKLDSKTYLISSKKEVKTETLSNGLLFKLEGNMHPLTNVKGDKMILFFLENLPIFKSTRDFFNKTKMVNLEIKNLDENRASIKGNYTFKNGYFPLNEILKFAIQNNIIRVK